MLSDEQKVENRKIAQQKYYQKNGESRLKTDSMKRIEEGYLPNIQTIKEPAILFKKITNQILFF